MTATIEAKPLAEALGRFRNVIDRKAKIPILSCVRLTAADDRLTIEGHGDVLSLTARVPAEGDLPPVIAPFENLHRFAQAAPGDVTLAAPDDDGGPMTARAGRARARFWTLPEIDWPERLSDPPKGEPTMMPAAELHAALEFCQAAISTEESRFYLCGVYLDPKGFAVATNGHAGAATPLAIKVPEAGCIVPPDAVRLALGFGGEVAVTADDRAIRLVAGETVVRSRLVDGSYPEWERVLGNPKPAGAQALTCQPKELLAAVRRLAAITGGTDLGLRASGGLLYLRCTRRDDTSIDATEAVGCEIDAPAAPFFWGVNPSLLVDALEAIDRRAPGKPVVLRQMSPGDPMFLSGDFAGHWVIMPLRGAQEPEIEEA